MKRLVRLLVLVGLVVGAVGVGASTSPANAATGPCRHHAVSLGWESPFAG